MTDFELRWSSESIKEYVTMNVRGKDGTTALPLILCIACFAIMAVFSVVIFFVMNMPAVLILGGIAVVFAAALFIGIQILINSLSGKLIKANENNKDLNCSVDDSSLIITKNNIPINIFDWEKISAVSEGKTAYFITTSENMLLILEKNAVISGDPAEAERIITAHKTAKKMNSGIKVNFQKELEKTIASFTEAGKTPALLLHCCCAPCSSYVLEYLSEYFRITTFFYNPNITEKAEYEKRANELRRLINELPMKNRAAFTEGEYCPERFFDAVRGHEADREGGERCFICYRLRLSAAADAAAQGGFDYFTTTLSISPLKNAAKLNEIGASEAERTGTRYLFSDFKKREGYKRSIVLSEKYSLYRQDYCGCVFSRRKGNDNNESVERQRL